MSNFLSHQYYRIIVLFAVFECTFGTSKPRNLPAQKQVIIIESDVFFYFNYIFSTVWRSLEAWKEVFFMEVWALDLQNLQEVSEVHGGHMQYC